MLLQDMASEEIKNKAGITWNRKKKKIFLSKYLRQDVMGAILRKQDNIPTQT
jgi:hypothetical protein